MKKLIALTLSVIAALSLTYCGEVSSDGNAVGTTETTRPAHTLSIFADREKGTTNTTEVSTEAPETAAPTEQHDDPVLTEQYDDPAPAQQYDDPAPVQQYDDPAPAQQYDDPAPAQQYDDPAPAQQYDDPAPAQQYDDPAPAQQYDDPAPAQQYDDPAPGDGYAYTVYITPTGKRYHYLQSCAGKNATPVSLEEAQRRFTPCKKCAS